MADLFENLLSMLQLVKKCYTLKFLDYCYEISKDGKVILEVNIIENSLLVDFEIQDQFILKADIEEESKLWHRKFSHFNYATLKQIQTQ